MSNGSNAICWGTAGGSAATPTVAGIVLGCTTATQTALGCNALVALTTGFTNAAYGANALCSNTSGSFNSGIGASTLCSNTTGANNTAVGFQALRCSTTASFNVAVGNSSLLGNTTGTCNTAVGYNALRANSSGCFNVSVGNCAGGTITTGCQNVAVGSNVQLVSATGSCQLAIGFSATDNWLTGDSTKAIKPGAGVIDCAGSCGTAGQVLQSTGSNAIQWANAAPGYTGYNGYKSSVTTGTKFNVTGYQGELGINFVGQLNIFTIYDTGGGGGVITPGSNALIFINGFNGVGTSTVQAFDTSTGTFAVEAALYPAYTDITVTFTPTVNTNRMNFYIRFLDAIGNGGPGNGTFFTPYLTIF
jgi:hypothetical protein